MNPRKRRRSCFSDHSLSEAQDEPTSAEAREQATVSQTNKMPMDSRKPVKGPAGRLPRPGLGLEGLSTPNSLSSNHDSAYSDAQGGNLSVSLHAKQVRNGAKNPRSSRHFDDLCSLPAPDKQYKFSPQRDQGQKQAQTQTHTQRQTQTPTPTPAQRPIPRQTHTRESSYAASATSQPASQQPTPSPTSRNPSPAAGKLTSKARSTSYTSPLPLFQADESKLKSGKAAPLTEQNLRSHLRSLHSSPSTSHRPNFGEALPAPPPSFARPAPAPVPASEAASVPTASHNSTFTTGMRKSKSPKKHDKDRDKDKKKSKHDPNTHPLNLPPDQLRQLFTAQMARQEAEANRSSMSMDRDTPEVSEQNFVNGSSPPATPSRDTPGAFPEHPSDHSTNGTTASDERSPTPPPHRVTPQKVDPEACKAAGNKFFKAKDYERAIAEYTKGMAPAPPPYFWMVFFYFSVWVESG